MHCHRCRHYSSIRSHYFAQFGVAIVRCNYFRRRLAAVTFAVDATVAAADADSEAEAADVNWAAASRAFVDSD